VNLPARWTDKEGWQFHIEDTGIVRECIQDIEAGKEVDIERIEKMVFKQAWMENDGEGNPPNYDLIKAICEEIFFKTDAGEFHPGFIERRVYRKAIQYALVKLKQDTAYREIMGGWLTVTMLNPTAWTNLEDKESRIAYFKKLVKWLDDNYKRERTKPWVMELLGEFLRRYNTSTFVEESTNYFYNRLIEQKEKWMIDSAYDPSQWYPVGRGFIQNEVRGGRG
jgi:hypothetical protein